ncbi:MAG: MaoC family dehydratase [Thiotrichales bacterium]|nr:MaoC family dehydratase [Thiotrichales bacterium]
MGNQWFEDFEVGQRFVSQGVTLTEASIIDFATRYDPQRFHIDREAAAQTHFGGIIASGFQTLGLSFRMFFELGVLRDSGIGAPGIEELRWTAPVRPGDTLHTEVEVIEVRPSRSKSDRGTVRLHYAALNHRGETVMTLIVPQIVSRRPSV